MNKKINLKETQDGQFAIVLTNLTFVLGDVINTLMNETEARLARLGISYDKEVKRKIRSFQDKVSELKVFSSNAFEEAYKVKNDKEVDNFVDDSDKLVGLLLLMIDRQGNSEKQTDGLIRMLSKKQSVLNLPIDVYTKDLIKHL